MDKLLAFLLVIGILLLVATLFALPIMLLWNYCLVPAIPTVLVKIGVWQALGIKLFVGLMSYTTTSSKKD